MSNDQLTFNLNPDFDPEQASGYYLCDLCGSAHTQLHLDGDKTILYCGECGNEFRFNTLNLETREVK